MELCWDFNTAGLREDQTLDRVRFEAWFDASRLPADFAAEFQEEAKRRRIEFRRLRFDELEDRPELRIESQKKVFAGFDVGETFRIHPGWESPSAERPVNILMEPGHAFGTGSHESTRLCLRAMVDALPREGRFLDVGAGSGILSIAAAKLRPRLQIFAMDNDPLAVEAARSNLARNGVSTHRLFAAELQAVASRFDFVAANLTLEIFRSVAPLIARMARGPILTSGFTAEQGPLVADCFRAVRRLEVLGSWAENGWLCFLFGPEGRPVD